MGTVLGPAVCGRVHTAAHNSEREVRENFLEEARSESEIREFRFTIELES